MLKHLLLIIYLTATLLSHSQDSELTFVVEKNYCPPNTPNLFTGVILEDISTTGDGNDGAAKFLRIDAVRDTFIIRRKINQNCTRWEQCVFDLNDDSTALKFVFNCNESELLVSYRYSQKQLWGTQSFFSFSTSKRVRVPIDYLDLRYLKWDEPHVFHMGAYTVMGTDTTIEFNGVKLDCYRVHNRNDDFAGDFISRDTYFFEKSTLLPVYIISEGGQDKGRIKVYEQFKLVQLVE